MAAIYPRGGMKYWFNGQPFQGIKLTGEGTQKYWFNGQPFEYLFPLTIRRRVSQQ